MSHKIRRSKNYLVGDYVSMFKVIEYSLLLDCQNVAIAVKELIVKRVNTFLLFNQSDEQIFSEHSQLLSTLAQRLHPFYCLPFRTFEKAPGVGFEPTRPIRSQAFRTFDQSACDPEFQACAKVLIR